MVQLYKEKNRTFNPIYSNLVIAVKEYVPALTRVVGGSLWNLSIEYDVVIKGSY